MKKATILHIPHASTRIPKQYLHSFDREKLSHELDVMTDWFCDELFESGRNRIVFPVSRLVCDVERFRDDEKEIMAKLGMGVTYRCASDLSPLRNVSDSERRDIIARYYDTHHRSFTGSVEKTLRTYGQCLIIDCHSFYPSPLPYEIQKENDRPDFCIGTSEHHTPKELTENLVHYFSGKGYSVKINSPFEGTIVPMKFYEKDINVISVMIEVNRKLYMDSPGMKSDRFPLINSVLREGIEIAENTVLLK